MSSDWVQSVKAGQLEWALENGFDPSVFEFHKSSPCVLQHEVRQRNLYRPEWWSLIAGKEHKWARSLDSSQCFAVNLFAPIYDEPHRAACLLRSLLPQRGIDSADRIEIFLEFTPQDAPAWLGEGGHPTQVDVYFHVSRGEASLGHLLIEVKFAESGFGGCRGWKHRKKTGRHELCLNMEGLAASAEINCYMAESEGRTYWNLIAKSSSSINIEAIKKLDGCPFRSGLYQIMRNRLLADQLREKTKAVWADFAVCIHPGNEAVRFLDSSVAETENAIEAFRKISSESCVRDWDAGVVLEAIESTGPGLEPWASWMRERYFDSNANLTCHTPASR